MNLTEAYLCAVLTRSAAKAAAAAEGATPSPRRAAAPRPGRTPLRRTPVKGGTGLHAFLQEVDIQFLDHMRRGASINLADLASDPPPHSLQVRLRQRWRLTRPLMLQGPCDMHGMASI